MKGKILLCAYYFPPIGTPRSYRWKELVKQLSLRGWEIDVLTIRVSQNHPNYDPELLEDIPNDVTILRTYPGIMHRLSALLMKKPFNTECSSLNHGVSLRRWIGEFLLSIFEKGFRTLLIPDEAATWIPFALITGRKLVRKNNYDLIISSAFPFTSHVAGYFLKYFDNGKAWIADYGDPWVSNPYLRVPKWRAKIDKRLETVLLKSASKIIVNTDTTKDHYLSLYPFLKPQDIKVITQGFSREGFLESPPETADRFRIVYAGIFYKDREPYAFFDALKNLKEIWKDVEVIIAGNISKAEYHRYAKDNGLSEIVRFIGFVPQKRIFSLEKGASVLLLIGNRGGIQVPGKVYEYFASKRPILHITLDENDITSALVEKFRRGISVANDPKKLSESITYLYNLWKSKRLDKEFNLKEIDEFCWDILAEKLEETILDVMEASVRIE
jgi:glycosyltransferase involved in cell wall biosynthesis